MIEEEICKEDESHSIEHQKENKFRNFVKIKIISTKSTEEEANRLFADTVFSRCITDIGTFQGCEAPVIVLLYGVEERNNYSELINMCSRAQYKGGIRYY